MKKVFSILFALLILISGMHFSFTRHICGGAIATVKISLTGEKASCGMENPKKFYSVHNGFNSNCCQNEVSVYSVDCNYSPSSFQIKEVIKNVISAFYIPVNFLFRSITISVTSYTNVSPRNKIFDTAVILADICFFLR